MCTLESLNAQGVVLDGGAVEVVPHEVVRLAGRRSTLSKCQPERFRVSGSEAFMRLYFAFVRNAAWGVFPSFLFFFLGGGAQRHVRARAVGKILAPSEEVSLTGLPTRSLSFEILR